MTVYFASTPSEPDIVKIGYTDNLQERMQALAASCPDGIHLRALCHGSKDVEAVFHKMFSELRVEGEWFRIDSALSAWIDKFRVDPNTQTTVFRKKAVTEKVHAQSDQDIAHGLLSQIMQSTPSISVSSSIEDAFHLLMVVNPVWTRRRVRAIWEKAAVRIDHFEVRDLTEVLNTRRKGD